MLMHHPQPVDPLGLEADRLSEGVIGAAIAVHRALGPGLLESAYEACLCHELTLRGMSWKRQVPIALSYRGRRVGCAYRADLVVSDCLVIEIKAIESLDSIHVAQVLTYLRLLELPLALLLNFNTTRMTKGIRRIVNRL